MPRLSSCLALLFSLAAVDGAKLECNHLEDLGEHSQCRYLNLFKHDLGDDGARKVAAHFKKGSGLKQCHLFGNKITDVGASEIAHSVMDNRELQALDLGGALRCCSCVIESNRFKEVRS